MLRNLVRTILQEYGYTVLEAIMVPKRFSGNPIRGPNSFDVDRRGDAANEWTSAGRQVGPLRPEMKVIYMSGLHGSSRDIGSRDNLSAKPFTPGALTRELREVLDNVHPA